MLLLALPILLAAPLQDPVPAPEQPMLALERLTEGAWVSRPGGEAMHFYDWGAGKRSLLGRTVSHAEAGAGEPEPSVDGEALWFHDPVAGHYRVLGFQTWGRVEGSMTRNHEVWTQTYQLHLGERTLAMRDLWKWEGPRGGQYVSHFLVDGEEQRQEARFSSRERPERPAVTATAKDLPAGPLEPLAFLVGGTWEMKTTWPGDTPFHVQDEHRWGANKLCLWKRTYRIGEDGSRTPTVDGVYYADVDDPEVLRFVMIADEGALYEGTVSREEDELTFVYRSKEAQQTMDLREVHRFAGTAMKASLWLVTADGEQELFVDAAYQRLPEKDDR